VATAVHRVMTEPGVRDALLEGGAEQFEHFSLERTKARFAELIEQVVSA
jgi:hypothetical protein